MPRFSFVCLLFALCWTEVTYAATAAGAPQATPSQQVWLDNHKTITVGVLREDWPPYQITRNGQLAGLSVDYLKLLIEPYGLHLQSRTYPNLLALFQGMCKGEADLVMNVSMTPDRTQCMAFTEPYVDIPPVLVARKDNPRYHNDSALPSARIAYEKDTATENWLRRRLPTAIGMPAADTASGLLLVEHGRADVYLGDPYVITQVMDDDADSPLGVYTQNRIARNTIHFAVPRDRLPLLELLNAGLAQLTPEQYQSIQSRWLSRSVGVGVCDTGLALTPEERRWLSSLPPLRLGFDPTWAPVSYVDANGVPSGITADYLDHLSTALGIHFTYVPTKSWGETLAPARAGKLDAIAPLNALPGAAGDMIYSRPFAAFSDVIVTAQREATPISVDDLAGKRVVVSDPREIPEPIARRMAGARILTVSNVQEAMAMVADGKADAYIGNAAVADLQIRSRYAGTLRMAAPADIVSAQAIGISREYARLVPLIDRVIAGIPEKEQQRIRSTWLWSNYTSGLAWRTFWTTTLWVGLSVALVLGIILTAYLRLRREIRQRHRAERELADQLSFAEALMETLPSPVVAKDGNNRYLAVNGAYEQAFHVSRGELIGRTTPETQQYQDDWNLRFHEIGAQVLVTGTPYHSELRLPDPDGGERVWLYWMHPFRLASGRSGGLLAALVDVTDIRTAEQRASALDQRLRRITAHLPAVVFELRRTPDGRMTFPYVGGDTRAMWDLAPEDMAADERTAFARVHPEDQAVIEQAVEASARTLQNIQIVFRSIAHERIRWIRAQATPQQEEDGRVFWSGVWTDVTEARGQAEALAAAKEEAEAAAAAKASFLATMSHEIRTPMNGILGLLELLGEGPLTANQQRMLRMVDDSAAALMQILDDVLDFSKIDAGQFALSPTPIDLRALVDNVLGVASTLAHEKGLYVRNAIDAELVAELIGDGIRLRQILFNLLSNATKFTEQGSIGVRLQVLESDGAQQRIRLVVRDTGIGMTAEQQARLFEPFTQADATIARRFGGTGLGLTICQRLVSLMDGRLTMCSAPGEGTTMAVELSLPIHRQRWPQPPLRGYRATVELDGACAEALTGLLEPLGITLAENAALAALRFIDEASPTPPIDRPATPWVVVTDEPSPLGYTIEADGTCMLSRNPFSWAAVEACCRHVLGLAMPAAEPPPERLMDDSRAGLVLVAEDHPTNRHLIQAQLERLGYQALVVEDGIEALETLEKRSDVSLLITDCDMPRMDGYTLAAKVRASESADQHLPIVALTASALPDEAERCSRAGMDALLVKPAGMNELRDVLYRWMPALDAGRPADTAPAQVISPLKALADLFGPSARLEPLIDGFLSNARDDLGRLDEAVRGEDVSAVASCIHRINGAIKIFGGGALADTGERIREILLDHGRMVEQEPALRRYRQDLVELIDTIGRHRMATDTVGDIPP